MNKEYIFYILKQAATPFMIMLFCISLFFIYASSQYINSMEQLGQKCYDEQTKAIEDAGLSSFINNNGMDIQIGENNGCKCSICERVCQR